MVFGSKRLQEMGKGIYHKTQAQNQYYYEDLLHIK